MPDLMLELDSLLFKNASSKNYVHNNYIRTNFIYSKKYKALIKKELYEKSYEVYNKLYHFYSSVGDFETAKHVHYRREDVCRKLLKERGGIRNKTKALLFNETILKYCAGYGDELSQPIINSIIEIFVFSFLFRIFNGVLVNRNGTIE
jgi:hypothetical protein